MKKFTIVLNVLLLVSCLFCVSCNAGDKQPGNKIRHKIIKIKIIDRTHIDYYMNGQVVKEKVITDLVEINKIQTELDSLKEVQNMNVRHNMGSFEIILFYNDGTQEDSAVIYTVYDGVVFFNYNNSKEFKNDRLEEIVSAYFLKNNYSK